MKKKYESVGLNYELISEKYVDLGYFEEAVNAFLEDEFFKELDMMLCDEDYAMAKDATKGLFILAQELLLFPLYEKLVEIYEDLEYETYTDIKSHYEEMMEVYKKIRGVFNA